MPVITAAGLAKRIGDRTLFADLSFKLDRRERMTLAGRNGSGKTTLLRMLASEIGTDAGRVVLGKGVRVALHDQRPPRTDATLREYVTAGLAWIGEIEAELSALEQRMAESADPGDPLRLRRRSGSPRACGRLPLARRDRRRAPRSRLRRLRARPAARDVLWR